MQFQWHKIGANHTKQSRQVKIRSIKRNCVCLPICPRRCNISDVSLACPSSINQPYTYRSSRSIMKTSKGAEAQMSVRWFHTYYHISSYSMSRCRPTTISNPQHFVNASMRRIHISCCCCPIDRS